MGSHGRCISGKEVFLSIREGQLDGLGDGFSEALVDRGLSQGPFSGFLSTMERVPGQALLVVACDLPLLDESILRTMIEHRGRPDACLSKFKDGLPNPSGSLRTRHARGMPDRNQGRGPMPEELLTKRVLRSTA